MEQSGDICHLRLEPDQDISRKRIGLRVGDARKTTNVGNDLFAARARPVRLVNAKATMAGMHDSRPLHRSRADGVFGIRTHKGS
jgi:hypothetical protein